MITTSQSYRYFRLTATGTNDQGAGAYYLAIGELELYGTLTGTP